MNKRARFIIPPSYYKREEKVTQPIVEVEKNTIAPKVAEPKATEVVQEKPIKQAVEPTPQMTGVKRRRSSLSLKSIHKEKEQITLDKKVDISNLPKNEFSKADFEVNWRKYIEILNRQGEKMLASILSTATPILKGTTIQLTYPNAMMVDELNKKKSSVLNYLRNKLQNYHISFELLVNEKEEKNYAYTPQEKYAKLVELNPMIAEMRKKLFLDI